MVTKIKNLIIGLLYLLVASILTYGSLMAFLSSGNNVITDEPFDYLPVFYELVSQGRIGEAINIGHWLEEHSDLPNSGTVVELTNELEKEHYSLLSRSKRLWRGFWTGEYKTQEDAIGALTSDILFIGDIRDLGKQALNKYNDQEVDGFIVALSTAGLASSVATLLPEPTSTATGVAAESGITLLKGLKKSGALTSKFSRAVKTTIQKPRKLAEIMEELVKTSKNSPPGTIPYNMRFVENIDDLKALNRGLEKDPKTTTVLLSRVDQINYNEFNKSQNKLVNWAKHKVSKGKYYARLGKFIYTGRFINFLSHFLILRIICGVLSLVLIILGYVKVKKAFE